MNFYNNINDYVDKYKYIPIPKFLGIIMNIDIVF